MRSMNRVCAFGNGSQDRPWTGTDLESVDYVLSSPVYECLASRKQWKRLGLATVMVSRMVSADRFVFAVYMVDVLCLGVKDTFVAWNESEDGYQWARGGLAEKFDLVEFGYEDCRSLILGAIDFAAGFGFEPHSDWSESSHIIEAGRQYEPKFEFGENGTPVYIPGPRDNAAKVLRTLRGVEHIYRQTPAIGTKNASLGTLC